MEESQPVQRGFRIRGRVQGVFFRAWTQEMGRSMGLAGTVRNLPDGSVEAHVVGLVEAVERFQASLWEGPPASRVDGVEVFPSHVTLDIDAFRVLH